jgi:hypothetical protein
LIALAFLRVSVRPEWISLMVMGRRATSKAKPFADAFDVDSDAM